MVLEIVSVNVARPSVLLEWPSGDVVSSIDKKPVLDPTLTLSWHNLKGDAQADTRPTPAGGQVHGGDDQAVYAFPAEHLPFWSSRLSIDTFPGLFGENLTTRGAMEGQVCIGDVWAWGSALLQVTAPRGPCYKLGIRLGRQAVRKEIRESGRVGWYLRVLQPGEVPTRGAIDVVERHPAGVTVAAIHAALQDRHVVYPDLAALEPLSRNVRAALLRPGRDVTGGVPEADRGGV